MQEIADKVATDTYTADEFNTLASQEMQNLVINTGQTLNSDDLDQLHKGIAIINSTSLHFVDSGSANAYVVNSINSFAKMLSFTTGDTVRFFANSTNTTASTISVNGLSAVSILDSTGAALTGNELIEGEYVTLINIGGNFILYNFNDVDSVSAGLYASETSGSEGTRLVGNTNAVLYDYLPIAFGYISYSSGYTLENSYNIASISEESTGIIQVTFQDELSSDNYSIGYSVDGGTNVYFINAKSINTTSFIIVIKNTLGVSVDTGFSFTIYGGL